MSTPARSASAPSRSPACRSRRASWTLTREALVRARHQCCPRRCSRPAGRPASSMAGAGFDGCRGWECSRSLWSTCPPRCGGLGRAVGRMSWRSTSAPRTRPAAFSAKSSRSPVRGSGPISRTAAISRVRHPMRAAIVIASVMCMRLSFACIWLVRTRIPARRSLVVGHTPPTVGCRTGERGEWLVPGTTRDSNVQGPGKKAQIAQGLFAVKERWWLRGCGAAGPRRCNRRTARMRRSEGSPWCIPSEIRASPQLCVLTMWRCCW